MKFVAEENGKNPEKTLPRPRFVHHDTHMECPRRELGIPVQRWEERVATIYEKISVLKISG